ncbi:hypothetical protein BTVI_132692 [Pitangus sulphuratus]|nr:hypothetical protein BTVI_132692 [Pitangus sulphuratus]
MAENISTDLNLPEPARPRVQQVTYVQGKSCCSRTPVSVVVAVLIAINLLQFIVLCRIIMRAVPVAGFEVWCYLLSQTPGQHGMRVHFCNLTEWDCSRHCCVCCSASSALAQHVLNLIHLPCPPQPQGDFVPRAVLVEDQSSCELTLVYQTPCQDQQEDYHNQQSNQCSNTFPGTAAFTYRQEK